MPEQNIYIYISGFGDTCHHSQEPLKTPNQSYDSSLHVGHKCSKYIIKFVKYVQKKPCEYLFVQIHWNKYPVTLLYSVCRNLYVMCEEDFSIIYYFLFIYL